jgi:hypothetical protein
MSNTYEVELRFASGATTGDVLLKHVQAEDGYEAVALARQLVALQNPEVDIAMVDSWSVTRQRAAAAR